MPDSYASFIPEKYIVLEASKEELWFQSAKGRIARAIATNQWPKAQVIALDWADGVCDRLGLTAFGNWKFFKRSVVARWFGSVENKRFLPGWSTQEALEYANSFKGRQLRLSVFSRDVACHAPSLRLPADRKEMWESILAQVDKSIPMEMFPESSTEKTICFRRYTTLFGESISYEAGKGQAMQVFEQERGQHPIVLATKGEDDYTFSRIERDSYPIRLAQEIDAQLRQLIESWDKVLTSRSFGLCRMLGIDSISIEGYFDSTRSEDIVVVDVDLPFDFVFMVLTSG